MKFRFVFGLFWLWALTQAQVPYVHQSVSERYAEGVRLFESQNYRASREIFEALKKHPEADKWKEDVDFYLLEIAVRTGQSNVPERVQAYLNRYPYSPYRNVVMMHAVDYYFAQNRLDKVRELIDNMEVYQLSEDDRERLSLYEGYILLKEGNLSRARRAFKSLEHSERYGDEAKYYLGYIAYRKNNLVQAQRYFSQVQNKKSYQKNIPYYNADMYYRSGQFEKAIEEALKIYKRSRGKEKSELAKIIGSSYFNLGQYDKAIPYLKAYKGKKGKWAPKDYYELGFAYYKKGDCEKAIPYFNKIISGNDALSQNAYYHLAKCYLKSGNKAEALNAFKKVSEMDFDKRIQEDGWYQYIKLAYEIGSPYETLDEAVKGYLQTFPESVRRDELKNLLVSSYLTSRNFDAALKAMESNRMQDRPEYQKVAFFKGMELFNEGKYADAIKYFDLSLKYGKDKKYRDKAVFWKAESLYRQGKYEDALTEYKAFELQADKDLVFENKIFPYNMGYTYFKLKQYDKAAPYFKQYLEKFPDAKLKKDALLRLGDSYFASRKYWQAMEAYNKAIQLPGYNSDYAFYQKAVSYGFVSRPERKIEELKKFLRKYPKSPLTDDALYQLGNTYLNLGRYNDAVSIFDILINKHPKSPYIPIALLKKGLAYYNTNHNEPAKTTFKKLIKNYPQTPEALEAADYLKNIYIDENNIDEYLAFIKSVKGLNVETSGLENEIFEAAEQKYFEQNPDAAQKALETYLKKFPQGIYKVKAYRYLAKIHDQKGAKNKAYTYYEKLAQEPENEYTVEALRYLALEDLRNDRENQALEHLKKLEDLAQTDDDNLFAISNLKKIYERKGDDLQAMAYAQKVVNHPKASARMKEEAEWILARAAVKNGDDTTARELYNKLTGSSNPSIAAEAMYYKALFEHKEGKYDLSNKTIATLSKKYPSKKFWGGKALILMAKNMHAKGDLFNSTYILENVIKRFKKYPEIIQEAQNLLNEIKNENTSKNQ